MQKKAAVKTIKMLCRSSYFLKKAFIVLKINV